MADDDAADDDASALSGAPSAAAAARKAAQGSAAQSAAAKARGAGAARALHKLALVSESSEKDVFGLQPVQDGALRHLHRMQRMMAVLKQFINSLQAEAQEADKLGSQRDGRGSQRLTKAVLEVQEGARAGGSRPGSGDGQGRTQGALAPHRNRSDKGGVLLMRPPDPAETEQVTTAVT